MKLTTLTLSLLLAAAPLPAADLEMQSFNAADFDSDGALNFAELVELYLHQNREVQQARPGRNERQLGALAAQLAREALKNCPAGGCSFQKTAAGEPAVRAAIERLPAASKQRLGWKNMRFSRFIADPVDPRGWKTKRPAVFSAVRDNEAAKRDRFNFLGAAQLVWKFDSKAAACHALSPGMQMDVDGSKVANETTVIAAVPWQWIRVHDGSGDCEKALKSSRLVLTPSLQTDRAFDREVFDLSLTWSLSHKKLRTGIYSFLGEAQKVRFAWMPSLTLTAGKVEDTGGNAKLEVIRQAGSYTRAAARVSVQLGPTDRLSLGSDYFLHYDLRDGWTRGYGEASLTYDAADAKNVHVTLIYRKGKKPPTFARVDQILFGIGILQ